MTHFTDSELRQWSRSGPGPDRERVVAHLGACAQCAASYADAIRAQALTPDQPTAVDTGEIGEFIKVGYGVPASGRAATIQVAASRLRTYTGLAAAAVLIAAIAVPYMTRPRERNRADVSYRGSAVQALAPVGEVDPGTEFAWSAATPAPAYRVEIGDATGAVYSTITKETRTRLPADVWRTLTPGVDYWWTVAALGADNREIASTGRQAFTIRPR